MRFFHKYGSLNYRFFGLVDNILLKREKKQKYTSAINYLERYTYILDKRYTEKPSNKYPDKIWQCWFQGQNNMPFIVKKCTDSVQKYHGERVIFLDKTNIFDYINLPQYIIDKHSKGIIPYANFSDILRLSLLLKHGGCWVDSTIFLTEKIPDEILNSDFFTFRSFKTNILKYVDNIDDFNLWSNHLNSVISIESPYFIKAKAGNPIINGVLNLFLEYWKYENEVKDYLMIDKFFILTLLHNKTYREAFLNMPEYYIENVLMLQHAQFEEFNQNIFDKIKSFSSVHKLTHKNLKRNPYKNSFLEYILHFDFDNISSDREGNLV